MMRIVTLCSLLLISTAALAQGKVKLRMNLNAGDEFTLETLTTQTITQEVMGQKQVTEQAIGMRMDNKVQGKNGDIMTVDITYSRTSQSMKNMMMSFEYDSNDDKPVPQAAQSMAALVGKGFSVDYNQYADITAVRGSDKLAQAVLDSMELPPGPQGDEAKKMITANLNDDGLRQMLTNTVIIFPEDAVGVGDSWTRNTSLTMSMGVGLQMANTYKVTAIEGGVVSLDVATVVTPLEGQEPLKMMGMEMTFALSGNQSGTVKIDAQSGLIIEGDLQQDFSGTMAMSGPQSMEIPMSIKGAVITKKI